MAIHVLVPNSKLSSFPMSLQTIHTWWLWKWMWKSLQVLIIFQPKFWQLIGAAPLVGVLFNLIYLSFEEYAHPEMLDFHEDVIKWKHFLRYWPFVRGIHRSSVNSPHKGQWSGASMFSLICAWINRWVNNREAGDLRCHRAHHDVMCQSCSKATYTLLGLCMSVKHFFLLSGRIIDDLIYKFAYVSVLLRYFL